MTWKRHNQTNTRPTWYTSEAGHMIQLLRSGAFECWAGDQLIGTAGMLGGAKNLCETAEFLHGFILPWKASSDGRFVEDATRRQVAYLNSDMMQSNEDRIGKAQLFSAAPELAEALKDAAELAEECANDTAGTPTGLMFMVRATKYRAALEKAGIK